ncbi:MAG: hypothetical protein P4L53_04585 [Candidatus Obscuribacterales bacterium]|nr:hypothetical protein [Candidatus Obscuribacterales bacterium]
MARPGAMQLAVSTTLAVLFGISEGFWIIKGPASGGSFATVGNDFLLPLAIIGILAWHYTAGFQKYAADKGLDAKEITSFWRGGFIGLYLMLKARDRCAELTGSELDQHVLPTYARLSSAQNIKMTIILVAACGVTMVALPWALWLSNYAQANDDFAKGHWNTLRIGFAEEALQKFPNSQDLSKVFSLKSKIHKASAAQMRANLPLMSATAAAEWKKNIDHEENVAKEAAAEATKLSSENWGVSSTNVFIALGTFYLVVFLLAGLVLQPNDKKLLQVEKI